MNTKEFKVDDRIQFTTGETIQGRVVVVRDYEPSLGVIWDGYTKVTWYISSSDVFEKVEEDIKVGDRVEYVGGEYSDGVDIGEKGTVVVVEKPEPSFGVRWDKFGNIRHNLYGNCDSHHGVWVSKKHIRKIEENESIAEEIVSDFERMVQRVNCIENEDKNQVLSPKEMLKAGMVVEMANGEFGLFDGERIIYHDGFDEINALDDELRDIYIDSEIKLYADYDEFSIVAMYKPTCGYTLQNLDRRVDKFEVVWKKEGFVRKVKKEFGKDELVVLEDLCDSGFLYIARDEDGELCAYKSEPTKNSCCWAGDNTYYLTYVSKLFQCVAWEDEEPVKISDFI